MFSIGKWTGGIISKKKSRTKSAKDMPPWSADSMTLDLFMEKMCRGDMADAQDVLDEYLYQLASVEDRHAMDLERDSTRLRFKIVKASAAQYTVAYTGDPKMAQELVSIGAVYTPYPLDRTAQVTWFRAVSATINRWVVELKHKYAQIDALKRPVAEDAKIDMPYFNDALTELSKFMKVYIDPRKTTVGRYISMLKNFRNHVESYARK